MTCYREKQTKKVQFLIIHKMLRCDINKIHEDILLHLLNCIFIFGLHLGFCSLYCLFLRVFEIVGSYQMPIGLLMEQMAIPGRRICLTRGT